jgi:hypothetical protein
MTHINIGPRVILESSIALILQDGKVIEVRYVQENRDTEYIRFPTEAEANTAYENALSQINRDRWFELFP